MADIRWRNWHHHQEQYQTIMVAMEDVHDIGSILARDKMPLMSHSGHNLKES